MNIGEVVDGGFEINRSVLLKIRSSKLANFSFLIDWPGNGDVDEATDVSENGGAGLRENSFVVGRMEDHGIVAAGSSVVGSNNG